MGTSTGTALSSPSSFFVCSKSSNHRIITGINPYDPLYDFDCDGVINDQVEKNQWLDNWFNGVLPCDQQATAAGDGTILTNDELESLAKWMDLLRHDGHRVGAVCESAIRQG